MLAGLGIDLIIIPPLNSQRTWLIIKLLVNVLKYCLAFLIFFFPPPSFFSSLAEGFSQDLMDF